MELFNRLYQQFVSDLKIPLAILAFGFGPLFVVGLLLHRKKARFKSAAQEPFTELPLRPPGESLRIKIEELSEKFDEHISTLGITSCLAAVLALLAPDDKRTMTALGCGAFALITYVVITPRLFRTANARWQYRLGFMGERVVGEELNQLLAHGFHVFHDVPFENFNIDHVLVGTAGVYAVETKSWRKPTDVKGLEKARVYSDGETLRFPKFTNTTAIAQARRNATALADWLTSATGERVAANAILTFPGWSVIREKTSDVNVLRPDEIKRSFPTRPARPLSAEQIRRVAHQLTERCRITA